MLLNSESVIETVPAREGRPSVACRFSGDEYLLVEFGEMSTDFFYNLRAMALGERARRIPGVIETVPAERSLVVHFDSLQIGMKELLAKLKEIDAGIKEHQRPCDTVASPQAARRLPGQAYDGVHRQICEAHPHRRPQRRRRAQTALRRKV